MYFCRKCGKSHNIPILYCNISGSLCLECYLESDAGKKYGIPESHKGEVSRIGNAADCKFVASAL